MLNIVILAKGNKVIQDMLERLIKVETNFGMKTNSEKNNVSKKIPRKRKHCLNIIINK